MIRYLLAAGIAILASMGHADALSDKNKALVIKFYTDVLFYGKTQDIDKYIGDTYIQHNPNVADGKEGLLKLIAANTPKTGKVEPFGEIVRAIAENNLVVLHVRIFKWPAEKGGAVAEIFRVADGKIVEHWDVVQAVPETAANNNTMF